MQAAKFAAEGSAFVGPKQTMTEVLFFNGETSITKGAVEAREYFEADNVRPIPGETLDAIELSVKNGSGWSY